MFLQFDLLRYEIVDGVKAKQISVSTSHEDVLLDLLGLEVSD